MVTPPLSLVVAAVAGLGLAGYGFHRFYARELVDPYDATTTGTVLESDIDPEASAQRSDYTPTVRYAYPVDGVDYENDNVRAGSDLLSRQGGTVLLGEYHEDATVTVHYDPADSDRSVLVPPAGGQAWLLFVAAGLLVAVIAGGLAVLGL